MISARVKAYLLFAFLAAALFTIAYAGNLKNTDHFLYNYDTRFWHTAGVCWIEGASPYQWDTFTETWTRLYGKPPLFEASFVYPPVMAVLAVPLGLLPPDGAALAMRLLNLFAYAGILWGMHRLVRDRVPVAVFAWCAGATAFLASVTQTMTQGQSVLLVLLGIVLALVGWRERRPGLYVLGFVLAAIKPQLSALFLAYTALMGAALPAIAGAAITLAISLGVLWWRPVSLEDFQHSLRQHLIQPMNHRDGYDHVAALFGNTPLADAAYLLGLAGGVAGVIWMVRRQRLAATGINPDTDTLLGHLMILAAMTAAALPIHRYDLVIHIPLLFALPVLPRIQDRAALLVFVLAHNRIYTVGSVLDRILGQILPVSFDHLAGHASSVLSGVGLALVFWLLTRSADRPAESSAEA